MNTKEKNLRHDHNHDGLDGRGFLESMAWAGTGMLWTVSGGLLGSTRLPSPASCFVNVNAAIRKESFVQQRSIASRFVAALCLVALASGAAHAQYRFTRIADETGSLRFNGSPAAINDAGRVTFAADTITGSGKNCGGLQWSLLQFPVLRPPCYQR